MLSDYINKKIKTDVTSIKKYLEEIKIDEESEEAPYRMDIEYPAPNRMSGEYVLPENKKGLFVTFEGIDCSGKSTQFELLKTYLDTMAVDFISTRGPGGTRIGEQVRSFLLEDREASLTDKAELFLLMASRVQLLEEVINPALLSKKVVLCDRFYDSTLAYQGFGRGGDHKLIEKVNNIATEGLKPDLTILFDISPEIALNRLESRKTKNHIDNESLGFYRKIRDGYLQIAKGDPERFCIINADNSIEEIARDVINVFMNVYVSNWMKPIKRSLEC